MVITNKQTMNIPREERALILQGGGSLGAYESGAFSATYSFLKYRNIEQKTTRPIFDIVAGTSIGAINAAILVSYVVENETWEGSAEKLAEFWDYISTESMTDKFATPFTQWWDYWSQMIQGLATGEAARRYYSSMEFEMFGAPKVFSPPHTQPDTKFWNIANRWNRYSNQHLKESLERFAKFPISTSHEKDQPRLILTSVDVMDGKPVTFDSYAKEDGTWKTEYGEYLTDQDASYDKENDNGRDIGFEHVIHLHEGITADHVLASAAVPVSYDYVPLKVESYNFKTKNYETETRYFWDGGLLANTPLVEVIILHRRYWYQIKGVKDLLPKLGIVMLNVTPARISKIPWDFDGVINRAIDISLADKTERTEAVSLFLSYLVGLNKKLIDIAKSHGVKQSVIDQLLDERPEGHGKLHSLKPMQYRDLVEGQFNIGEIVRIERQHTENDTSKKIFDFSANTIRQLKEEGYRDVTKFIGKHFGSEYLKAAGMQDKMN